MSTSLISILVCVLLFVNQDGSGLPLSNKNPESHPVQSTIKCIDLPYTEPLPPPGIACEKELLGRHGRPFMFPAHDGIAFGISSVSNKPLSFSLWVDNQTSKTVDFYFCCATAFFEHIDIFDSEGHRVLSKRDRWALKANSEGQELIQACTCSGTMVVAPRTVELYGSETISEGYDLGTGQYIISERFPPSPWNFSPDKDDKDRHVPPGLAISIP